MIVGLVEDLLLEKKKEEEEEEEERGEPRRGEKGDWWWEEKNVEDEYQEINIDTAATQITTTTSR